MSLPTLDADTDIEERTDKPHLCESGYCAEDLGKPPHEADFHSILSACGCGYDVCAERVALYAFNRYIRCQRCKTDTKVDDIIVFPLKEFPL